MSRPTLLLCSHSLFFFFSSSSSSFHDCQLFSFWTIDIGLRPTSSPFLPLFTSKYSSGKWIEGSGDDSERINVKSPSLMSYITVPLQQPSWAYLKNNIVGSGHIRCSLALQSPPNPYISLFFLFLLTIHWQQLAQTTFIYSIFFSLSLSLFLFRRCYYGLLFNLFPPFPLFFPLFFSGFIAVLHYTKVTVGSKGCINMIRRNCVPTLPVVCMRMCARAPLCVCVRVFFLLLSRLINQHRVFIYGGRQISCWYSNSSSSIPLYFFYPFGPPPHLVYFKM